MKSYALLSNWRPNFQLPATATKKAAASSPKYTAVSFHPRRSMAVRYLQYSETDSRWALPGRCRPATPQWMQPCETLGNVLASFQPIRRRVTRPAIVPGCYDEKLFRPIIEDACRAIRLRTSTAAAVRGAGRTG